MGLKKKILRWKIRLRKSRGDYATCNLFQCRGINDAACRLAREVAEEGDGLVAGGLSQTPTYLSGESPYLSCRNQFATSPVLELIILLFLNALAKLAIYFLMS